MNDGWQKKKQHIHLTAHSDNIFITWKHKKAQEKKCSKQFQIKWKCRSCVFSLCECYMPTAKQVRVNFIELLFCETRWFFFALIGIWNWFSPFFSLSIVLSLNGKEKACLIDYIYVLHSLAFLASQTTWKIKYIWPLNQHSF